MTLRLRNLAALPVMFTVSHAFFYFQNAQMLELLWLCNCLGFLQGLALATESKQLLGVTGVWSIIGILTWLIQAATTTQVYPTSIALHFGLLWMAWLSIRQMQLDRFTLVGSFAFYLAIHGVTLMARSYAALKTRVPVNQTPYPFFESVQAAASYYALLFAAIVGLVLLSFWILKGLQTLLLRSEGRRDSSSSLTPFAEQ